MDPAEVYRTSRHELIDLGAGLSDGDGRRAVPALPGWTVRDTFAHLAGGCADILDGRMEGAGSPAWTAAQVEERADRSLADLCAEWAERGPDLDEWLRVRGEKGTAFICFDVWTHQQDIGAALGRSGPRDDRPIPYLVALALPFFERRFAEAPAVRVVTPTVDVVLGGAEGTNDAPAATLHSSDRELLRLLFGRRSARQMKAADWEGDPAPFIDLLHLFELPLDDLSD